MNASETFTEACSKAIQITYMIGINDILKGETPIKTIFTNILTSCSQIKMNKKIVISTIPPTKIPETFSQVRILNSMLMNEMTRKGYTVVEHAKLSSLPMSKVVLDDNYSLTDTTVDTILETLVGVETSETGERGQDPTPIETLTAAKTATVQVPTPYMKHIIGRNRTKLNTIEKQTHTKALTRKWSDSQGQKNEGIQITGEPHAVQEAVQLINNIIQERKQRDESLKDQPCRYLASGSVCFKGDSCPFGHHNVPQNTSTISASKIIKLN